jgi:hypothetical protein
MSLGEGSEPRILVCLPGWLSTNDGGEPEAPGREVKELSTEVLGSGAAVAKMQRELGAVYARLEELEKKVGLTTGPRGDPSAVTPTDAGSADVGCLMMKIWVGDDDPELLSRSGRSTTRSLSNFVEEHFRYSQRISGSQVALLKSFKHMQQSKHKLRHTAADDDKISPSESFCATLWHRRSRSRWTHRRSTQFIGP